MIKSIKNKKKEIPEPIPQNEPPQPHKQIFYDMFGLPINDNLGQEINDKYDGVKIKDKFLPISSVAKTAGLSAVAGVGAGLAGTSILNNVITTGATAIGYQLYGDTGAAVANLASSGLVDRYNSAYQPRTSKVKVHENSEYTEIPAFSSNHIVNGGTVVMTKNKQERVPSYMEPQQRGTLIGRLGNAIKDVSGPQRPPVSQKIKESKLLLDLEQKQKTHGTVAPSTLTNITDKVKDIYRRLSGKKKGQYTQVPTNDEGLTQHGTYAILPQNQPHVQAEIKDFEREMETMLRNRNLDKEMEMINRSAKKRQVKDSNANLVSQLVGQEPTSWPAMEHYQERNERNIRQSIEATNKREKEDRIKQGLTPPAAKQSRQPRTPKQQNTINNLSRLVSGSTEKKKEKDFNKIMDQASKLIEKKISKKKQEQISGKITKQITEMKDKLKDFSTRSTEIETRNLLKHELDKSVIPPPSIKRTAKIAKKNAIKIQNAFRNKQARNEVNMRKTIEINTARRITNMENELTRTENMLNATHANINEQRPEGLRKQLKKIQDRKSDLVNRNKKMDREQKKEELRLIDEKEQHYQNVIKQHKRGPKVKDLANQYTAALTPKKK